MFIDPRVLNDYLDKTYFTDGQFKQDTFTKSLTLVIDNDPHYNEMAKDDRVLARPLAFWVFRRVMETLISLDRGTITTIDIRNLQNWEEVEFCFGRNPMQPVIDHINALRNNEREADTMSNTEIISTNITNDIEKEEGTMENIITCAKCGEIIENTNLAHEVDGDWYCDDCFNEKYTYCDACGEIIERDDAFWYEDEAYCEDCFGENFAYCARCDEAYPIDDMTEIDGDYYCEDCRDRQFVRCDRCGEWVRDYDTVAVHAFEDGSIEEWCSGCYYDYASCCEDCGEAWADRWLDDDGLCPDCSGRIGQNTGDINDWRAPRGVRNYGYKPDPCMCYTEDDEDDLTYGLELEVDKAPSDVDLNDLANFVNDSSGYTYVKHDGSLSHGMEIVSHPASIKYHMSKKDTWEMIFNELISNGLKSHDAKTCGLHVHIGLKKLNELNEDAAVNLLFLMDHYWDKFVKFSRRTETQLEHWARRYSKFHGDFKDWKKQAKETRDRYYALNFQNTHTIEIRMFRGTLNLDTFIATLQFVDVLIRKCIEITSLPRLQSIPWEELVESDWPELNAYLKSRGLLGTNEEIEAAEAEKAAKQQEIETAKELVRTLDQRVRVVRPVDGVQELVGCTGTVVTTVDENERLDVLVFFDPDCTYDRLHVDWDAPWRGPRCWWCESDNLEPICG